MRHSKAQIRQFDSTHRLTTKRGSRTSFADIRRHQRLHDMMLNVLLYGTFTKPQQLKSESPIVTAMRDTRTPIIPPHYGQSWGSPAKSTPLTEFQRVVAYARARSQPLG